MSKFLRLHQIIKSFNTAEKRHFTLLANLNKRDQNYLSLYGLIDKQENYDEKSLSKSIDKKGIKNVSIEKKNLENALLKSLRVFHEKSSHRQVGYTILKNIENYIDKGLFDIAKELINKNETYFLGIENYSQLIMLYEYKETLMNKTVASTTRGEWNEFYKRKEEAINKLLTINNYRALERQILLVFKTSNFQRMTAEDKLIVERVINSPLITDYSKADSFDSRYRFFYIQGLISIMNNRLDEQPKWFRKILDLLEENPKLNTSYHRDFYFLTYNNYLNALLMTKSYKKTQIEFNRASQMFDKTTSSFNLALYYTIKLSYVVETGDVKESKQLIDEVTLLLEQQHRTIGDSIQRSLLLNLSVLLFIEQQYDKSLKILNDLINKEHYDSLSEQMTFIRAFILFIYLEQNNIDMIEYYLNQLKYFLKSKNKLDLFEKYIIQFFNDFLKTEKLEKDNLKNLKSNLEKNDQEGFVDIFLKYFNLMAWTESKITNKKLVEVLYSETIAKED